MDCKEQNYVCMGRGIASGGIAFNAFQHKRRIKREKEETKIFQLLKK
jgi:ABC-type metal ion transport system substrate-binding protein